MAEKTRYSDAELEEFRAFYGEAGIGNVTIQQLKKSLMGLDVMIPTIHLLRIKYWKKELIRSPRKKRPDWHNVS
jgi:hypothetical protein